MTVRLHVDAALAHDAELELPASAARHVQVRRLQPTDRLVLFNGLGGEWTATVLRMGRSQVTVRVDTFHAVERELQVQVTVALGMPANERMDLLVEKATELGVYCIQPLLCERSVLRLAGDRALRKREHWQTIAAAAAEQCTRTRVPRVAPVMSLERWLQALEAAPQTCSTAAHHEGPKAHAPTLAGTGPCSTRVLLSPRQDAPPLHALVAAKAHALITLSGPEGGLSPAEQAAALARGFVAARLGERVLRAETAPLAVLAWIGLRQMPGSSGIECAPSGARVPHRGGLGDARQP
ncbi:MAG TPA: 16S rRNA (uracil(1498)-N(3))-methyltransferase [Rubrivivax sp.]|nr:16S rRNA (uracil(1498)-N(3))-methyltransferase [Rubrivivax sp.]